MKNWKYGGNPKKVKYATRKAQPGYQKARAAYGIGYVFDPKKPNNNPRRAVGHYVTRRAEPAPLPQEDAAAHSPEAENAASAQ